MSTLQCNSLNTLDSEDGGSTRNSGAPADPFKVQGSPGGLGLGLQAREGTSISTQLDDYGRSEDDINRRPLRHK